MQKVFEPHTLVFPMRQGEILLGLKKKGLGTGNWNGFGGKVEPDETIEEAAKRELQEEAGLTSMEITPAGILTLHYPHVEKFIKVSVFYTSDFSGQPLESDEMQPRWFGLSEIPFHQMWADDKHWVPLMLSGKKFEAQFIFRDFETIIEHTIEEML